MKKWCSALVLILICPILVFAEQPTMDDLSDDSHLLLRADVRKELELVDDQAQGMQSVSDQAVRDLNELLKQRQEMPPSEFGERVSRLRKALLRNLLAAREEFLLPHQLERLTELRWRYRSLNDPAKSLDQCFSLTRAEHERVRSQEGELRDQMLAQLRAFRQRSELELLDVLTPAQRAEWSQKIGATFEFEPSDPGLTALRRLR